MHSEILKIYFPPDATHASILFPDWCPAGIFTRGLHHPRGEVLRFIIIDPSRNRTRKKRERNIRDARKDEVPLSFLFVHDEGCKPISSSSAQRVEIVPVNYFLSRVFISYLCPGDVRYSYKTEFTAAIKARDLVRFERSWRGSYVCFQVSRDELGTYASVVVSHQR